MSKKVTAKKAAPARKAPAGTAKAAKRATPRAAAKSTGKPKAKAPERKIPAKKAASAGKAVRKAAAPKSAGAKKVVAKKVATRPAAAKPVVAKPAEPKRSTYDPVVDRVRKVVLNALDEIKAKDIREIDVRGKTSIADCLVIASGTSTRHVKSIADEVVKLSKQAGNMPIGVEGQREAEWVLVDLGDIIVHVMLPRVREFYGLERLWTVGDAAAESAVA